MVCYKYPGLCGMPSNSTQVSGHLMAPCLTDVRTPLTVSCLNMHAVHPREHARGKTLSVERRK